MKILHVMPSLKVGGAEKMLVRLVQATRPVVHHHVISLTGEGPIGAELVAAGASYQVVRVDGVTDLARAIARIRQSVSEQRATIIQSWLYHADLLAGLARLGSKVPVIWNIRSTMHGGNMLTGRLVRLNAFLSRYLPHAIVCCGEAARAHHVRLGYDPRRMVVIPNGFDIDALDRRNIERLELCSAEFAHGSERPLALALGRDDGLKNYDGLLRAMALLPPDERPRLMIVGRGVASSEELTRLRSQLGLIGMVALIDEVCDVRPVLRAADFLCNMSLSEGFPNVVCEAMAMSLPVAATDVGETSTILGETGWIAKSCDPNVIAACLGRAMLAGVEGRTSRGAAARQRIVERYSIKKCAQQYINLWSQSAGDQSLT